jgi:uncharacterized protein YceK
MRRLILCLLGTVALLSGCLSVRQVEEHRVASVGVGPNGVTVQDDGSAQERTWRGPSFVRPDSAAP